MTGFMTFMFGFIYIGRHAGSYVSDLYNLCHKCVTDVNKR